MLEDLTASFVKMKMLQINEALYEKILSKFSFEPCNIKHISVWYTVYQELHSMILPLLCYTEKKTTKNKLIATMKSITIKS